MKKSEITAKAAKAGIIDNYKGFRCFITHSDNNGYNIELADFTTGLKTEANCSTIKKVKDGIDDLVCEFSVMIEKHNAELEAAVNENKEAYEKDLSEDIKKAIIESLENSAKRGFDGEVPAMIQRDVVNVLCVENNNKFVMQFVKVLNEMESDGAVVIDRDTFEYNLVKLPKPQDENPCAGCCGDICDDGCEHGEGEELKELEESIETPENENVTTLKNNTIKTLEYLIKRAEDEKESFDNKDAFPGLYGKLFGKIAAFKEAIRILELEYRKTPEGIRADIKEALEFCKKHNTRILYAKTHTVDRDNYHLYAKDNAHGGACGSGVIRAGGVVYSDEALNILQNEFDITTSFEKKFGRFSIIME